ncbi:MAG: hypothetical protein F6K48_05105 [Okeania sp. SIO3H1]|nr:hypothetical protein [Okeania sp. SIO3H1]
MNCPERRRKREEGKVLLCLSSQLLNCPERRRKKEEGRGKKGKSYFV